MSRICQFDVNLTHFRAKHDILPQLLINEPTTQGDNNWKPVPYDWSRDIDFM